MECMLGNSDRKQQQQQQQHNNNNNNNNDDNKRTPSTTQLGSTRQLNWELGAIVYNVWYCVNDIISYFNIAVGSQINA